MSFDQTAVPESCPGTSSSTAGSAAGCQGCPNQAVCSASAASGQDPRALAAAESRDIARRLQSVAHKLVVLSGKGGVGKSTFSTTLARGLASLKVDDGSDEYCHVGLLDVDICGPSIPLMMGVEGEDVHNSSQGWSPVFVEEDAPSSSSSSSSSSPSSSSSLSAKLVDDETIEKPLHDDEGDDEASKPDHLGTIAVMSVGFLLESEDQAVIWRGPKKNGLIKQFLRDVDWGPLDYLVIDTPPGTSDEHLSLVSYLKAAKITGAVVVTTPQELSLLDVRKEINFCRKVGIPIIGVVENMSAFVCPKCSHQSLIFPPTTGGAAAMAAEMSIPFLGSIPIDPRLARACDEGQSFLALYPDSPAALSYHQIIQKIVQYTQSQTKK